MILLLLILFSSSQSANIFAGAFLGGSHFTAIYDLAVILADAGHNITFVNMESGQLEKVPSHPNIHGIDIIVWDGADKNMMWENCIASYILADSSDEMRFTSEGCVELWTVIFIRSAEVYTTKEVRDLFTTTQFDVILGEKVDFSGLSLLGTLTHVPVVNFEPGLFVELSLLHCNLPVLITSQPSLVFNRGFHLPPSFIDRLSVLRNALRTLPIVLAGLQAMQPFLEKFEFSSLDDVKDSIKLFLTNDHPAFTFPFLRPPNDIPIGCANLLGSQDDPIEFSPQIAQFLEESADKDVVYVSLGSYVKISEVSWYSELIDILIKLDLRVIVTVDKNFDSKFPKSVLPLTWAPQKDLLRSGKVKLFISHCGNNGRLETIFYNVPVLCIPLFGDQPVNAELIKLNGFGDSMMKEEVPIRASELVPTMNADHEKYCEKMKKASDIVENEPGNVRKNFVFYIEHVAKFKNVDYLVNKVIKQQSLVETYNLDIILPLCLILLTLMVLILWALYKLCTYCVLGSPLFGLKKQKCH